MRIYFESVAVDYSARHATVRVVVIAPREPVLFMISFLLHNDPAPIGSKVISTCSLADLYEQRERNVPCRFSRRSWGRKIA